MKREIIYEKTYPRTIIREEDIEAAAKAECELGRPEVSFDEMMRRVEEKTTYLPVPERIRSSEEFIREAIDISELYSIDLKIVRFKDHISADLSFDCGGGMRYINRLFGMTDQFSFFRDSEGPEITVSLDYYTHIVMRNGRVVSPDISV